MLFIENYHEDHTKLILYKEFIQSRKRINIFAIYYLFMNKQMINKTANLLLAFTVGMVFLGGYLYTNPVFSTSKVLQNIYLLIFGAGGILIILILVIFTAKGKKWVQ